MSVEKDKKAADRWFMQAVDDYEAAVVLKNSGMYAQACFYMQQSAEKAVKSLWYYYGEDPWGHSISRLIEIFPIDDIREQLIDDVIDDAKELDQFYIPTRYPNGVPADVIPKDVYTKRVSEKAASMAENVIEHIRRLLG